MLAAVARDTTTGHVYLGGSWEESSRWHWQIHTLSPNFLSGVSSTTVMTNLEYYCGGDCEDDGCDGSKGYSGDNHASYISHLAYDDSYPAIFGLA